MFFYPIVPVFVLIIYLLFIVNAIVIIKTKTLQLPFDRRRKWYGPKAQVVGWIIIGSCTVAIILLFSPLLTSK